MIKFEHLPNEVLSKLPAVQDALTLDANIIFAYLFGGLSKGSVKPLSDIDIAVFLKETGNPAEYKLDLFSRLADALGTSELDLVVLNTAPTSLAGRILQQKQVLVDKEPARRHSFESLMLREFFDFRITEEAFFSRRYGVGR